MLRGRFRRTRRAGNGTCGFVRSSEYTDAEPGRTLQARSFLRESRRSSQLNDSLLLMRCDSLAFATATTLKTLQ